MTRHANINRSSYSCADAYAISLYSNVISTMVNEHPKMQRAWRAIRRGAPSKALALQDIPVPTLSEGEVLVKVQAAALNPVYASYTRTIDV